MTSGAKLDGVTGIITVAIGGITASLSPSDLQSWGASVMSLGPLLLIIFLIWRIHKLDKQHSACQDRHNKMQEQLLFAYTAIQKTQGDACPLPTVERFITNDFTLSELDEVH